MKYFCIVLFLLINVLAALELRGNNRKNEILGPNKFEHVSDVLSSGTKLEKFQPVEFNSPNPNAQTKVEVSKDQGLSSTLSHSSLDPTPRSDVIQISIPPTTKVTESYNYQLK